MGNVKEACLDEEEDGSPLVVGLKPCTFDVFMEFVIDMKKSNEVI